MKKIIIILILIIFIIPFGFLLKPQQVEAQWAVEVVWDVPGDTPIPRGTKEGILDAAAWMLAKYAISEMTQSIVEWINSGFEGSPTFVENPADFLADIADQTTGVFIKELGMTKLCSIDWLSKLKISLQYSVPYVERMQCTFSGVVENMEDAYKRFQDSFLNGGWNSWISMTSNPQNNIYGAYLMSLDELAYRKAKAEEHAKTEVTWGSGFMSLKKCSGGSSQEDFCSEQLECIGDEYEEDPDLCFNECMEEDMSTRELCELSGGTMKNTTPGNVIAEQLNLNLGSSVRQQELADEIEESLAAIFNALISQLISTGLSSLSSTSGEDESEQWYNEEPSDDEIASFTEALDYYLDYEYQYKDAKQNSVNAYDTTINKLETLKSCYQTWGTVCQSKIDATQTQIASYESAKAVLDLEVTNSNNLILQAEDIKSQMNDADTYSELSDLYSEFSDTIQPSLHSSSDVDNAESEYESIKATLDAENSAIDTEYSQCLSTGCSI